MTNDSYTNQIFTINVGDGHHLRVVDWGNPTAKTPFVFLHGGPGGHVKDKNKIYFDPTIHRVIFFDQRGCGESTPYGSLKNNTITALAEDIIKIADHLHLSQFNLYGYSWGSTLALYTAINYPERAKNLVIGGVYSGDNDLPTMFGYLQTFFPEVYAKIIADVPTTNRQNFTKHLQSQAIKGTSAEQKHACYILNTIEGTIVSYDSDLRLPEPYDDFDPVPTRVETHFIANNCFIPQDYLLKNAHKITAPTYIIQGRSDLVCPPRTAYEIAQRIPNAKLYWANSNHYYEREVVSLIRAVISLVNDTP